MKRLLLGLLVFLSAVSIAHAQTTFTFPSSGVCSSTATPPEYCFLASNQTTGTSLQADCQMAMNSGASLHVVANKFLTRQYVSGKYGRNHFAFTVDPGTSLPGTVVTN